MIDGRINWGERFKNMLTPPNEPNKQCKVEKVPLPPPIQGPIPGLPTHHFLSYPRLIVNMGSSKIYLTNRQRAGWGLDQEGAIRQKDRTLLVK